MDRNNPNVEKKHFENASITTGFNTETGAWQLVLAVPGESYDLRYQPDENDVPPQEQVEYTIKGLLEILR